MAVGCSDVRRCVAVGLLPLEVVRQAAKELSRIDKSVLNVCPSCSCHDESMSHITWCRDPERTRILKDSVEQLVKWLYDQQTDGELIHLFKEYQLAGGMQTLTSLLKPGSKLGVEAVFHD
jgi:hypothetical protein